MYGVPVTRLELIYNEHTPRMDFIISRSHREVYRVLWKYFEPDHPWRPAPGAEQFKP